MEVPWTEREKKTVEELARWRASAWRESARHARMNIEDPPGKRWSQLVLMYGGIGAKYKQMSLNLLIEQGRRDSISIGLGLGLLATPPICREGAILAVAHEA